MVRAIFLHPDLGIGGAERLVVDAGLALQEKGHRVSYVTNHHDPNHCFIETRDGTFQVTVVGDWIPRSIFGYSYALMAYIRMLYLTMYLLMFLAPVDRPDVLICDQIPIGVPLIKLMRHRIIFYCHFPDLLLSKPGGKLKSFYRQPINWLEEKSMSFADRILVNSRYTAEVFKNTFKSIHETPTVLYPSINTKMYETNARLVPINFPSIPEDNFVFLSINRFERKKNLELAILALHSLETIISDDEWSKVHLLITGGYDTRVPENIEYYDELQELCKKQNISSKVTFLQSPSDHMKVSLLKTFCKCVLYTPDKEHFGIVPLEAMAASLPVIAVNSGGPTETIVHEATGYLSEPIPENFAHYMAKILCNDEAQKSLGEAGKSRFHDKFSFAAFSRHLNSIVFSVTSEED